MEAKRRPSVGGFVADAAPAEAEFRKNGNAEGAEIAEQTA